MTNRKLGALRRVFTTKLNKCTNFKYDMLCSMAYNGEGFYINHKEKVLDINPIWGYDKHYAYGGILIDKKFPLSCEFTDKETELGLFVCKLSYFKDKQIDFNYTIYQSHWNWSERDKCWYIILTNLDYEIFNYFYESDIQILKKYWFKDVDYLSDDLKDYVRKLYNDKKNDKLNKAVYEIVIYGLNAKELNQPIFKSINESYKYYTAYDETNYKFVREKEVPIAIFQAAYLRYEEFQVFKKYKDNIVYMNTDSVYFNENVPFEYANELGRYDIEFDNLPVQWICRNGYVVFNKDKKTFYKKVLGGIIEKDKNINNPVTLKDLKKLTNMESVVKQTYNNKLHKKEHIVNVTINPWFLLDYYNEVPQYL